MFIVRFMLALISWSLLAAVYDTSSAATGAQTALKSQVQPQDSGRRDFGFFASGPSSPLDDLIGPSWASAKSHTRLGGRLTVLGGKDSATTIQPRSQAEFIQSSQSTASDDGTWMQESRLSPRYWHSSIYDAPRNRLLVFAGLNHTDVWALALDGSAGWNQIFPLGVAPGPRTRRSVVYDPVGDQMVMFGGENAGAMNDVWTLSLAGAPTWSQLSPTGSAPPARYAHAAVYDPVRQRMIIYGGHRLNDYLDDVWALSLSGTPSWTQLLPSGPLPPAREMTTASYDALRDRVLIFGGQTGSFLNDVWGLSLSGSVAWSQLAPAGEPPSARYGHVAIYDAVRDQIVIHGGFDGGWLDDGWILSLASTPAWTRESLSEPVPSKRYFHTAVLDPIRDQMVVFGGATDGVMHNDVWALRLSGRTWYELGAPGARLHHSVLYDSSRDRLIVFGGLGVPGPLNDVWVLPLTGTPGWIPLPAEGTPPTPRYAHTAVFDPVGDRMLVFGGMNSPSTLFDEVWQLTLSGTPQWTRLTMPVGGPNPRSYLSAIYDPVRRRMVIFGGLVGNGYVNEAWALSLNGDPLWEQLPCAGAPPSPRRAQAVAYDSHRDRMLVVGGYNGAHLNDVWSLSLGAGLLWEPVQPLGTPPPPVASHSVVYDPARDRVVMFGGATPAAGGLLSSTWEIALAGSPAWRLLVPDGALPQARFGQDMVYDPVRDQVVMFGGGSEQPDDSYWILRLPQTGNPVTTSVVGRGAVIRSLVRTLYPEGSPLLLIAKADPGDRFVSWSGDTTTVRDTLAITVIRALRFVATFERDLAAAPLLSAVSDVPGDEGGFVRIQWEPSPIDTGAVPGVLCCYRIERRPVSPPGAPWGLLASVPVASLPSYSLVVPTPADSTHLDPAVFQYRLIAEAIADTSQWVSNEADGYSVDNVAPPAPASVSGVIASGFASLSWPAVSVPDFAHYGIYRGLEALPPIDAAHRVGTTTATTFNDAPGYFTNYRVTAIDVHGNNSPGTLFVPFNPADVPGKPAPTTLSVGIPFPSPMARNMSLTLGLPRVMSATVDILDSQGRLVRRLLEGERPAGWVTLPWDARDTGGHESAAGMYFVCVQTPEGRSVRRVVLIP